MRAVSMSNIVTTFPYRFSAHIYITYGRVTVGKSNLPEFLEWGVATDHACFSKGHKERKLYLDY